MSDQEYLT